ncbi:MAG: hypothetical protein ACYDEY_10980 [Acidimicrobiales bacterium]
MTARIAVIYYSATGNVGRRGPPRPSAVGVGPPRSHTPPGRGQLETEIGGDRLEFTVKTGEDPKQAVHRPLRARLRADHGASRVVVPVVGDALSARSSLDLLTE